MSRPELKAISDTALKRTCMRDQIRDVLVARILDGKYPAGTQLKELALAREFNVSQAPIREALRELEGSGLVTSERYRGTRVRGADLDEMRESYELRATLEVRAVELAVPCAPEVVTYMENCLRGMTAAVAGGDPEAYIDDALRLHRRLIEASGNRVFVTVWDSLHFDVRGRIALRRMTARGGHGPLVEMHAQLLDRIRAEDVAGAKEAVRHLFERVSQAFSRD
ncbi:MAG TPA: GntR family transcriptional regulator [Steroidobacteraceae bacterium]|nr:GntR family transcriptional regulator [Steroidobacteraceae bacterium]